MGSFQPQKEWSIVSLAADEGVAGGAAYADVPTMSVTFTPTTPNALVSFTASVRNVTVNTNVYIQAVLDGATVVQQTSTTTAIGNASCVLGAQVAISGLTPGASHTLKLQWKGDGGANILCHPATVPYDNMSLAVYA